MKGLTLRAAIALLAVLAVACSAFQGSSLNLESHRIALSSIDQIVSTTDALWLAPQDWTMRRGYWDATFEGTGETGDPAYIEYETFLISREQEYLESLAASAGVEIAEVDSIDGIDEAHWRISRYETAAGTTVTILLHRNVEGHLDIVTMSSHPSDHEYLVSELLVPAARVSQWPVLTVNP